MVAGAVPFVAAALGMIRELPGGHGFIFPNVAAGPVALLLGATVLTLGAYAHRRLSTPALRPNEELKPTASTSSLVE